LKVHIQGSLNGTAPWLRLPPPPLVLWPLFHNSYSSS
jgi:hypothetical protein